MSITQTYYLAHTARSKLTKEAARADHDLRLLVGHANLLDSLMLELADAEREQERWFNQTVSGATKAAEEKSSNNNNKHIQWAEAVVEDPEEDWDPEDASDLDSDTDDSYSDYDEDEFFVDSATTATPIHRAPSPAAIVTEQEVDGDDTDSDDDYDGEHESLTLTRSNSRQSPPELSSGEEEEESEDDSMPPSPEEPTFDAFNEKESPLFDNQQPVATVDLPLSKSPESDLFNPEYYVPPQDQGTMIEAF